MRSYSPLTFAVLSQYGKISHLGVGVRGLQCPKNAIRARNFKIFTFSRGFCGQTVRPSAPVPTSFCTTVGPLLIPPTALNFGPRPPWADHPQKVFPQFFKNLRGGGQFFECAKRGPPVPIRDKKIRNFAENRFFIELQGFPTCQKYRGYACLGHP